MQWPIKVLVFEQVCPGSAMYQQEGGTGIPHSKTHVSYNAYVKQVCQSTTPCMYANRTMLTKYVFKHTLNVSCDLSLCWVTDI